MSITDLITMAEAGRLLGVTRNKMWLLVKEGTLEAVINPLDKRSKLVRWADVQNLRRYSKSAAPQ